MASTEHDLVPAWLTPASLDAAMPGLQALVAASHWNQIAADWRLFGQAGRIAVIHAADGTLAASGAILPMGEAPAARLAWISMILVLPEHRQRGLGRRIFQHCLQAVLDDARVPMLDATPAGEPLYASFGFVPLWRLARWERAGSPPAPASTSAAPANILDAIAATDAQALGTHRETVLSDFLSRPGSLCLRDACGFALARQGRVASQIGPMVADTPAGGLALAANVTRSLPGRLFIDVPDHQTALQQQLAAEGFTRQRDFARMALLLPGQRAPTHPTASLLAIAGPEYG